MGSIIGRILGPFKHQVDDILETVQRKDVTQEALDEKCPTVRETIIHSIRSN